MTALLQRLLRCWAGQDVARRNAAQAAIRLQHDRRQRDDVAAYLAAHGTEPANAAHGSFCRLDERR